MTIRYKLALEVINHAFTMTAIDQAKNLIVACLEQMTIDTENWETKEIAREEIVAQIYMAADTYRRVYKLLERCSDCVAVHIASIMEDNRYLSNEGCIYDDFDMDSLCWMSSDFHDIVFLFNKYDEALEGVRFFLSVGTNLSK